MDSLTQAQFFIENGQDHESCNLSNLVFRDIDYSDFNRAISFFRSDFSRSRFYSCNFNKNKFGRADFIDVYIKNSDFEEVDFGSCLIKNAVIERAMFTRNNYHGIAIQYTCFNKCVFRDENFITNMYHCKFYECTFINCTFKKSSLDSNMFSKCEFIKVDMSECIAESLKFESCSLRNVYLCANLWITYLYKDTDIQSFGFKYRGENIEIWNGSSEDFINDLLEKKLFFEYLNAIIISDQIPKHGLVYEIKKIIPQIISQPAQFRKSALIKILDMLFFYRNYHKIPFEEYLLIYAFFSSNIWEDIPFDEVIIYESKLYKIKKVIESMEFELSYIKSLSLHTICISKFHINAKDACAALEFLENIFKITNRDFCNNVYKEPLIKVIKEEKGSVILTIASAALLVLLVSYVAKKVMHNFFSIQIENSLKKQVMKQLSYNDMDISDIKKSCALAEKYDLLCSSDDMNKIDHLSSEITKGEILGIILDFLF